MMVVMTMVMIVMMMMVVVMMMIMVVMMMMVMMIVMIFRHKYGKQLIWLNQIGQIFAIYNNQTITEN